MPLFYIDTSDQEFFARDEEGLELPDLAAAKAAAVKALPNMARDKLPDGDMRNFLAIVRDEKGVPLLQASLTLLVTSLIPNGDR